MANNMENPYFNHLRAIQVLARATKAKLDNKELAESRLDEITRVAGILMKKLLESKTFPEW